MKEAAKRYSIVPQSRPSEKNAALGSSSAASHHRVGQRRITAERFSPITFIMCEETACSDPPAWPSPPQDLEVHPPLWDQPEHFLDSRRSHKHEGSLFEIVLQNFRLLLAVGLS